MLQQFKRLDELLTQYRYFWQFQPFHFIASRWQQELPELHCQLNRDKPYESESFQSDKARAEYLAPWIPHALELTQLSELPMLEAADITVDNALNYAVNGRKWQQIVEFSGRVPKHSCAVVEWCAGKGHLGRVLASIGRPVRSLEWQDALCVEGKRLSDRADVAQAFFQRDVLAMDCSDMFSSPAAAVALHACGELHHKLLHIAAVQPLESLCLSPCCYHLISQRQYLPFSNSGKSSALTLYKQDLKLPLQETVTAGYRVRQQRAIEVTWRLAFDSLQRELRNVDEYLPLPTIPRPLLNTSFAEFCSWAMAEKKLKPTNNMNYGVYEAKGAQRFEQVQQMEFVQQLFRRPLEVWLLLDKVQFLQQLGYHVEAGIFCDYALTPRNLMIRAKA